MKKIILLVVICLNFNIQIFAQEAQENEGIYNINEEEYAADENKYYYDEESTSEEETVTVVYDQNGNPVYSLEDYKKLLEYKTLAVEAYKEGDYAKSYEYSKTAEELASNVIYTSKFLWVQISAENFKKEALNQYNIFKSVGGETNFTDLNKYISDTYTSGNNYIQTALTETNESSVFEDYTNAIDNFKEVITASISGYLLIDANKKYYEAISNKIIGKGDTNDTLVSGYLDKSQNYLNESDYDNSITNSKEAIFAIDKINQNLNLKDEAIKIFVKAAVAFNKAKDAKLINKSPDNFKNAHALIYNAQESLKKSDYKNVIDGSKETIKILEEIIKMENSSAPALPAYYVVAKKQKGSDSFWRIASYNYIYGSGIYWEKLYLANKSKLKDPENPFILQIGVTLTVPSLKGEKREGTYDNAKNYLEAKTIVIEDIVITEKTKMPVIEKPNY